MDVSFETLKPSLQDSIKKAIAKENFTEYYVTINNLSTRGDNFLGKLYGIIVKGRTLECENEINIFVKEKIILKKNKLFNTEQLYSNEILMYKEISKILTSLQDQANVPLEDRYKIAKAYDETNIDALILENLSTDGFKTYNKSQPVPLKFFELGIKELAKLHALSFVIENKMPNYFKEKIATLDTPFHFNEDSDELLRKTCRYVASLYDDETKIKIENFVPVLLKQFEKYHKDKTNICTLSHGDYKKNNILVRLDGGKPVEVVPVDYQFTDYGCPIRDLLLFIFSGTDREFRREHMIYLKDLYFETLSRFLKYFNMDVETVYPRTEFEKVYTEWLDYGLMMTLFSAIVLFAPETGLDFENLNYTDLPFCPDKKYDNILRDLVDDFVEWGYL